MAFLEPIMIIDRSTVVNRRSVTPQAVWHVVVWRSEDVQCQMGADIGEAQITI